MDIIGSVECSISTFNIFFSFSFVFHFNDFREFYIAQYSSQRAEDLIVKNKLLCPKYSSDR